MTDLIDRLRAGETGPELDLEIHRAITDDYSFELITSAELLDPARTARDVWFSHETEEDINPIPYTTSIDAALTLTPKILREKELTVPANLCLIYLLIGKNRCASCT